MLRSSSPLSLLLLVVIVFAGCRTYGEHESQAEMYDEMEQAVQQFSEELQRAEEDLHLLEQAAAESEALQSAANRYHTLTEEHRLLLEDQQSELEELSPAEGYRTLSRSYRAMAKEQSVLRQQYRYAVRTVRTLVQEQEGVPPAPNRVQDRSRYVIEPLGFPRSRTGDSMTMEEALQPMLEALEEETS